MLNLLHRMSETWWHRQSIEDDRKLRDPSYMPKRWAEVIMSRDGSKPYLIRYHVMNTRAIENNAFLNKWFWWASFRLTVHNTLRSDEDSALHDHPWVWASWILSGGYIERTLEGDFVRNPGHLRFRSHRAFHSLILDPAHIEQKEVWSIFFMGPHRHQWGFLVDGKKIKWDIYLLSMKQPVPLRKF